MSKILAAAGLNDSMINQLKGYGYKIVDMNYDGFVDAILYDSDTHNIGYLSVFDSIIDMSSGAFMLDVSNKKIDDIVTSIDNRSYGSLF